MIAARRVPEAYLEEFLTRQALLIKSRVGLFCVLSLVIYFLSTLISFVLYPSDLQIEEVSVWGILFFGGILFLIPAWLLSLQSENPVYRFNALAPMSVRKWAPSNLILSTDS